MYPSLILCVGIEVVWACQASCLSKSTVSRKIIQIHYLLKQAFVTRIFLETDLLKLKFRSEIVKRFVIMHLIIVLYESDTCTVEYLQCMFCQYLDILFLYHDVFKAVMHVQETSNAVG